MINHAPWKLHVSDLTLVLTIIRYLPAIRRLYLFMQIEIPFARFRNYIDLQISAIGIQPTVVVKCFDFKYFIFAGESGVFESFVTLQSPFKG